MFSGVCKNIVAREQPRDCAERYGYIIESYYTVEQWGHCNLAREYTASEVGCRERHGFDQPPRPTRGANLLQPAFRLTRPARPRTTGQQWGQPWGASVWL